MEASQPKFTRRETRRKGILIAVGTIIMGLALFLAIKPLLSTLRASPSSGNSYTINVSMAGFIPRHITVPANQPVKLILINTESSLHPGGGVHQFAIDELGIDVRITPNNEQTVTIPPLSPGTYEFYCDVCCGGRTSPSMIGVLEVTG